MLRHTLRAALLLAALGSSTALAGEVTVTWDGYVDLDEATAATRSQCIMGEVDCRAMDVKVRRSDHREPKAFLEFARPVELTRTGLDFRQVTARDLTTANVWESAYGFLSEDVIVTLGDKTWGIELVSENEEGATLRFEDLTERLGGVTVN